MELIVQKLISLVKEETPKIIGIILALCLLVFSVYAIYLAIFTKDKVVSTSQTQIETPAGVKAAAEKTGYTLSDDQSKQIAETVRVIYASNTEPEYTVTADGSTAKEESEKARRFNKADFSLITDKDNPDNVVDLSKLDAKTTVNLNQYNIQAYKKIIRQFSYGKHLGSGADTVEIAVNRKISNSGKYIGIGLEQELGDDHTTMVKLIYSW